jgi:hypothetical protein
MMMDDPKSKSEYYYGCSYKVWENLPYFEAIKVRRDKARELYKKLDELDTTDYDILVRKHKVYKAWQDNEKLLDERNGLI